MLRGVYPERSEWAQHDTPCQARLCRDGACPVLVSLPCPRFSALSSFLCPVLVSLPLSSLLCRRPRFYILSSCLCPGTSAAVLARWVHRSFAEFTLSEAKGSG